MSRVSIEVRLPGAPARGYEVVVGAGLLRCCRELLAPVLDPGMWALVADSEVDVLYGDVVAKSLAAGVAGVVRETFSAGEAAKSWRTAAHLQERLIRAGVGRDGALVALGGGVTGDLAGFVAATLYRGIPVVQMPTSLLAMVDSAVGGKTGIDVAGGKNLVGAFHQPALVIADTSVLATLADERISDGLAEVIKYGVVVDEQLFVDLEDGLIESCRARVAGALANVIERSVRLKTEVVRQDERETGRRAILNFGHTIGHGIEAASGYELSHGQAVAIGMVAEARLACRFRQAPGELPERLAALCSRAGLPIELPRTLSPAAVVAAARADKKSQRGTLRCALPVAIGEMAPADDDWCTAVSEADLETALPVA